MKYLIFGLFLLCGCVIKDQPTQISIQESTSLDIDLQMSKINIPHTKTPCDIWLTIYVKNNGTDHLHWGYLAGVSIVGPSNDGVVVWAGYAPEPGKIDSFKARLHVELPGTYVLTTDLDIANEIEETNELNNTSKIKFIAE